MTRPTRPARPAETRVPLPLVILALVGLAVLVVPLAGLVIRLPWGELPSIVTSNEVLTALRLSVTTATIAALVCLICGVPLAWGLARRSFPGRGLVRGLVTVPLVLPPVIGGVALLMAFGRRGVVGEWAYDTWGVSLPFTTAGVVVAQVFVAMPFLVVSVESALRSSDRRHEDVAATLGASSWTTFRRITIPAIAPGIVAGTVLCWARALGEFGATITFAGSFPGTTRTLPLAAYVAVGAGDTDTAIVLSMLMVVVSVIVLVSLRDRWLRA